MQDPVVQYLSQYSKVEIQALITAVQSNFSFDLDHNGKVHVDHRPQISVYLKLLDIMFENRNFLQRKYGFTANMTFGGHALYLLQEYYLRETKLSDPVLVTIVHPPAPLTHCQASFTDHECVHELCPAKDGVTKCTLPWHGDNYDPD